MKILFKIYNNEMSFKMDNKKLNENIYWELYEIK